MLALEHQWDVLPSFWPPAPPTPHKPAFGKSIGIGFSQNLCQHASNTSVATSTLSKPPCFALAYDKAKHALMQVQTCSLYIPFTTLAIYRVIILLAYNLKILTGPITFCSGYGSWHHRYSENIYADININEVTKKHAVPLSKVSNED